MLLPRLLAVALLVAAVGAIAALAGYARGRSTVDQEALRVQAYQAGRAAGERSAAAATHAPSPRAARPTGSSRPRGVSRAELSRAFASGRHQGMREASFPQRAHGRSLGAAAALGRFPSGWTLGRWYLVKVGPGGTLTAGRPRLASRVGPLAPGQAYSACRRGGAVCRVAAKQ